MTSRSSSRTHRGVDPRRASLGRIAATFGALSGTAWLAGVLFGLPLLSFAGVMAVASTFVPLPADTYVLHAATEFTPLTIAIVGGAISALAVLVERSFLLHLIDARCFGKLRSFIGTNRFVDLAERHLFWALIIAAASPLPFEVFRLVAVTRNFSPPRYAAATFIGRGVRFFLLASAGSMLADQHLLSWVLVATLLAFTLSIVHSVLRLSNPAPTMAGAPAEPVGASAI